MKRISVLLATTAVVLAVTAASAPAAGITGTYTGTTHQEFPALDNASYTTRIVFQVYRGRLAGLVGTVRMYCPAEVAVRDVKVVESWRVGRGPRVASGVSFSVRADGATIRGSLNRASGGGSISSSSGGCSGTGDWTARRR